MLSVFFLLALFMLPHSSAQAGNAPATGLVGSSHDMNVIAGSLDDPDGRVCAFCHTPHHALTDPSGGEQPLWSHEYTSGVTNYISYTSPTFDSNIVDPLIGPSRLCMSCHDGVIAVDAHFGISGDKVGLGGNGWGGGDIGLGSSGTIDLGDDHPIGFSYIDAENNDVGRGLFPAVGRAFIDNPNGMTIKEVLFEGTYLTCASCHDVHNSNNVANPSGSRNYYTYSPLDNSALCLTCHDKGGESRVSLSP